jgi:hypothetical protein
MFPHYVNMNVIPHLMVYFADSDPDRSKLSKLYVEFDWEPDCYQLPGWVDYRLCKFYNRSKERFKRL